MQAQASCWNSFSEHDAFERRALCHPKAVVCSPSVALQQIKPSVVSNAFIQNSVEVKPRLFMWQFITANPRVSLHWYTLT